MTELPEIFYDYRCDCGRLLFKSPGFIGQIEIKCRRCGCIKTISIPKHPALSK